VRIKLYQAWRPSGHSILWVRLIEYLGLGLIFKFDQRDVACLENRGKLIGNSKYKMMKKVV